MKFLAMSLLLFWPSAAHSGLCAARDLSVGQRLAAVDVALGDCGGDLESTSDVVGQTLVRAMRRGGTLRKNLLAQMTVVKRGERVIFTESGEGFAIDGAGIALSDGRLGAIITVACGKHRPPCRVLLEAAGQGRILN